jgi:hypothetical protein
MSEELDTTEPATSDEDELSTTPPNPALETDEDTGWKMPKPVFRKTSGYLPQGFAKNSSKAEIEENADDLPSEASAETPSGAVDVEPQPDLHESDPGFNYSPAVAKPVKKGGAAKAVFMILGLLLVLFLIAAFIGIVYFLFFSPSYDATF